MGKINQLSQFNLIALDSNCFIYLFEDHPQYADFCQAIFDLPHQKHDVHLLTSTVSLSEVLITPIQKNHQNLINLYLDIFSSGLNLQTQNINFETALVAAQIRAKYKIRLPDAFQLATAIVTQADVFISNDKKLKKVKEIKVLVLSELIR